LGNWEQKTGIWLQDSGFGKKEADSRQRSADGERRGIQASGVGRIQRKVEKNSPSPLIPFDRLTTPLSLDGTRRNKEKGIVDLDYGLVDGIIFLRSSIKAGM